MVEEALAETRLRGVENVSLRGIAQALGVSPSAAYNHFADKQALLLAVCVRGLDELDRRMSAALATHPEPTADAARLRFEALGRAYLLFAMEEPHLFRLTFGPLHATSGDEPNESGPYKKLLDSLIELRRQGLLISADVPVIAEIVWAATHGMAFLLLDGVFPAEAIERHIHSLTELLVRSTPQRRI